MKVFHFLFLAFLFVEVPDFQLFVIQHIIKYMFGIDDVLVDFVKILGHLCRLATKNAEVTVLLHMQFRINVDELKQQVYSVGKGDATPLGDGFFDGNHLRQPNSLVATFFERITQIECRSFVGEDHGQFLFFEVIVALYVFRQFGDESAFAHVKVFLGDFRQLAVVRACLNRTNNQYGWAWKRCG